MADSCPFCAIAARPDHPRILLGNAEGLVIRDGFPVSEGHSLIIARRHVCSFFALTEQERQALLQLLEQTQRALNQQYQPDGFNVGINDGPSAGQTIPHVHIHLIPRYADQSGDPRGGVRWVIPEKADYWSAR